MGKISHYKKALFLKGGTLGDIILIAPVIKAFKEKFNSYVTLACRSEIKKIFQMCNLIDKHMDIESSIFLPLFIKSDEPSYDLKNILSEYDLVCAITSKPLDIAEQLKLHFNGEIISVQARIPSDIATHATLYIAKQLEPLISCEEVKKIKLNLPVIYQPYEKKDYIVIHPGSGSKKKNWPIEKFIKLADILARYNLHIVFTLGEAEIELEKNIPIKYETFVMPNLLSLAQLLANARCYIGNDSGITHLAALLGTLSIALFGPTDPKIWAPFSENCIVVKSESHIIEDISIETVLAALKGTIIPD